jgi:hypothetical protein
MTQTHSISLPTDQRDERRRALAKVYRLLLTLAEEAERKAVAPEGLDTDEKRS